MLLCPLASPLGFSLDPCSFSLLVLLPRQSFFNSFHSSPTTQTWLLPAHSASSSLSLLPLVPLLLPFPGPLLLSLSLRSASCPNLLCLYELLGSAPRPTLSSRSQASCAGRRSLQPGRSAELACSCTRAANRVRDRGLGPRAGAGPLRASASSWSCGPRSTAGTAPQPRARPSRPRAKWRQRGRRRPRAAGGAPPCCATPGGRLQEQHRRPGDSGATAGDEQHNAAECIKGEIGCRAS